MKTRPILFSGSMVREILDGQKTQTRRVVKPQPKVVHALYQDASIETNLIFRKGDQRIHCPYGQPGDLLWVRETWWECIDNNDRPYYAATETPETTDRRHYRKRPSIHMPRFASRITLRITGVRVERLKDITDEDAIAEGVGGDMTITPCFSVSRFKLLWESINGHGSWDINPWVWVIEFEHLEVPA